MKEEMKNRISMALKDPILQQGFEIICKENAELKEKTEVVSCYSDCKEKQIKLEQENNKLLDVINNQDVKIADLEKQNKELQRKIDQLQGFLDHDIEYDIEQENLRLKKQIEKMKCCENCKTYNQHNVAYCGEPVRIKSYNTYVCDNWKLKE